MAPSKDVTNSAPEILCKSCSRPTKSEVKCVECKAVYHPSCAVRVTGIKVVGFNDLCCPSCWAASESSKESGETIDHQSIIKSNEILNQVILRLMDIQDSMRDELGAVREKLCKLSYISGMDRQSRFPRQNGAILKFDNRKSMIDEIDKTQILMTRGASGLTQQDDRADSGHGSSQGQSMSTQLPRCQLSASNSKCESDSRMNLDNGDKTTRTLKSGNQDKNMVRTNNKDEEINNRRTVKDGSGSDGFQSAEIASTALDGVGDSDSYDDNLGNDWLQVKNRRNSRSGRMNRPVQDRPKPIRGTKQENCGLVVAEKMSSVFLSGFHSETTPDDILRYLEMNNIALKCKCEKMDVRRKHVSSFKLLVPSARKEDVMSPDCWPEGVIVNHFLNLQRRWVSRSNQKETMNSQSGQP